MSLSVEALEYLADRGLSLEEVIEFARIHDKPKDRTGAERQARYRERKKAEEEQVTRDVTRDDNGVTDTSLSLPPDKKLSNPPTYTHREKPRARRAVKLPDNWKPVLTPAAQRIADGWPPGKFEREVAAFRDHAADKGRTSKDWQAAFRTWLNNAEKWRNDKPASKNDEPTDPLVRSAMRREAARLAGQEV